LLLTARCCTQLQRDHAYFARIQPYLLVLGQTQMPDGEHSLVPQSSVGRPLLALWLSGTGPDTGSVKQLGAVHQVYSLSPHLTTSLSVYDMQRCL